MAGRVVGVGDCLEHILCFLAVRDLLRLGTASKELVKAASESSYWDHLVMYSSSILRPSEDSLGLRGATQTLGRTVAKALASKKIHPCSLLIKCLGASSTGHGEDGPSNVLSQSMCYDTLKRLSENPANTLMPAEMMGLRCQLHCGCCMGRPCYWSSVGFQHADVSQFLSFSCCTDVSLVTSFSVICYTAFWHPTAPTCAYVLVNTAYFNYAFSDGPRTCSLQFISPQGQTYYASMAFNVSNTMSQQTFDIKPPTLFLGGEVKLTMYGMHQRQTLGEFDVQDPSNYYCCLSYVGLNGIPFRAFQAQWKRGYVEVEHIAMYNKI